jgi:hypothetical protein
MFPWYSAAMLALESSHVIGLRLMKLAGGGSAAHDETARMFGEKLSASFEAGVFMMQGQSLDVIVERYREHVAANAVRLQGVAR